MATREDVLEVMAILSAAYPNFQLTPETVQVYRRMLDDIDGEVLRAAATSCIRTSKWFPTVAELVAAATEIMANTLALPTAAEAWGQVERRMRLPERLYHDGRHLRPKPLLPIIEDMVTALGGWSALRRSENMVADRARFLEGYNAMVAREVKRMAERPEVASLRLREAARSSSTSRPLVAAKQNGGAE